MSGADPPRTVAGYLLEERIAVGGMAEIYRAVRTGPGEFQKHVALKMVLAHLGCDPQFVQMFLEEARLGARVSSPHLVQVFDFGEENGTYYLVMEHVDGVDLARLLGTQGLLPVPLATHLGRQLCAALADLHGAVDDAGEPLLIVHRDVNPGNVLLSLAGDVKLGDFGIAKARARSLRTERGAIKGKLAYLSPEQVRGDPLDGRTDLYALGLILFEALTGERYLGGETEAELLREAASPRARAPSTVRGEVPAWLDEVIGRLLSVEPAERHPDAAQLGAALTGPGPALDPAAARRELASRVARVRSGDASRAQGPLAPPAECAAGPAASSPSRRTEVLPPPAPRLRARLLVGAVALLAAGAVALLVTRPDDRRERTAAREAAGTIGLSQQAEADHGRAAADSATSSAPADATIAARDARRRRSRPAAAREDARAALATRSDLAAGPDPRQTEAVGRLAEVDRVLDEKGVLAADAPALFAERRTLAEAARRGRADPAAVARLLQRAGKVQIDRAFVEAKLARITGQLSRAGLEPRTAEELKARAARALSHAVTGRYTDANRELNAIHRRLEKN